MSRNLRAISSGNGSTIFADPLNILNTTRIKVDQFQRKVGTVDSPAVRLEVITARTTSTEVCDSNCAVAVSSNVRISVSGLISSKAVLKQQLADAYANALIAINTDAALDGFPVNPVTPYQIDVAAG